jgi:HSP20 family protein
MIQQDKETDEKKGNRKSTDALKQKKEAPESYKDHSSWGAMYNPNQAGFQMNAPSNSASGHKPFNWPGNKPSSNENFPQWATYEPAAIVYEEEKNLLVQVELPGIAEDEIEIQWVENTLIIKGEKKQPSLKPGMPFFSSKTFWMGHFFLNLNLGFIPEDTASIKAKFQNGVLTIKIKIPEYSKKKGTVTISA